MKTLLFAVALIFTTSACASAQCCKDESLTLKQRADLRDSVFTDTAAIRINKEITMKVQELFELQYERMYLERPNLRIIRA